MKTVIQIDGEEHVVDHKELCADLAKDGFFLVSLHSDGELRIKDERGITKIWMARVEGCGCNNTIWGDLPGGYEFCRSAPA